MSKLKTWGQHEKQDRRSLEYHRAAVAEIRRRPEVVANAVQVLDRWERVAPPDSKPLRDTWRQIIAVRNWEAAVEISERGNQLRQASPLVFVMPPERRAALRREVEQKLAGAQE